MMPDEKFQSEVSEWLACVAPTAVRNKDERMHRFLEEALELVQAVGCSREDAHSLVDYVFGRDMGTTAQEVGGVIVTLAALCTATGIDMRQAGEHELKKNWARIEAIRQKRSSQPLNSPLPQ